jgi:hypothetical protein
MGDAFVKATYGTGPEPSSLGRHNVVSFADFASRD